MAVAVVVAVMTVAVVVVVVVRMAMIRMGVDGVNGDRVGLDRKLTSVLRDVQNCQSVVFDRLALGGLNRRGFGHRARHVDHAHNIGRWAGPVG